RYRGVAGGRSRDAGLRAAWDDYLRRVQRYTRVEEREVRDEARILEAISEDSRLVALWERGEPWTSAQLADRTAQWERDGRDVALAIGGADGLPLPVFDRAELAWRLSALTLPAGPPRV